MTMPALWAGPTFLVLAAVQWSEGSLVLLWQTSPTLSSLSRSEGSRGPGSWWQSMGAELLLAGQAQAPRSSLLSRYSILWEELIVAVRARASMGYAVPASRLWQPLIAHAMHLPEVWNSDSE